MTHEELEAINIIAAKMGTLPPTPACSGPIVIHANGVIECHGTCDSIFASFHDEDTIEPCTWRPDAPNRVVCPRCESVLGRQ
jgi:hypothetical protein